MTSAVSKLGAAAKLLCIAALSMVVLPLAATAAGGGGGSFMKHADNDLGNVASLQRGAKYFMNYCQGCHEAQYVRYKRVGEALELSEEQLINNLMFSAEKPFETMTNAMPADDARRWFGAVPPDLSLVARSRGVDWIFSYLLSFYEDPSKTFGVNNLVLPNASMPHVLWELQGGQKPVYHEVQGTDGKMHEVFEAFESTSAGTLSAHAYEEVVRDIVNFVAFMGEPVQLERRALGVKVLSFILLFFLLAYLLKQEYWKQVK